MLFYLTKILTAMALPPFNIAVIWILSLIFYRLHYKKISRSLTILGIALLYLFSTPFMATLLSNSLVKENTLTLQDYRQAQAIVVLGGGLRDSNELYGKLTVTNNELERMRYAAYLHKETQLPILATGSAPNGNSEAEIIAKEFKQFFDVPTKWIESQAKTTKENALYTKDILEKEGINTIILVTQNWHMQRAKLLFEQQGFHVLPAGVGYGKTPSEYINFMYFVPQSGAMDNIMLFLKEWLGYWKEK
ncbi:hypothetical protein DDU33_05885 [Actinobacillus porcitonsillarum]|uniref:DUF218 domain-containing protein n=1 Tax=Actinobacillus porcitonsillarum TaxID=189834 RepID=A0A2U8FJ87_9PAST|nr:YdcF family protein [Actinobacillus porcitonsillarum]AWI51035.1 hypothetical protein DDU33_05885 [Actinobacillus porcitonsillarum]